VPYDLPSIATVLGTVDVSDYFGDVSRDDLIALVAP